MAVIATNYKLKIALEGGGAGIDMRQGERKLTISLTAESATSYTGIGNLPKRKMQVSRHSVSRKLQVFRNAVTRCFAMH